MDSFQITQKHYDTIRKQGYDNLPYEMGGYLGGNEDGLVMAILPIFNQHDDGRKDNFVFTTDHTISAHQFFQKHNLNYFGLYHSHPKGIAYPSQADINTGHRYHFIMSFKDKENPVFNAFKIIDNKPIQVPFKVISNKGFSSLEKGETVQRIKNKFSPQQSPTEDREDLEERISNIISEKPNQYKRISPRQDVEGSDFSTMA